MKATGRRAWRKWAKACRHNASRTGLEWCEGSRKCKIFALHAQDMAAQAKPFTPRSLVGRTMGARKRAARADGIAQAEIAELERLEMVPLDEMVREVKP